ncbi:MAG: acetylxylan esterase [Phycisphaerales bacterium]|nr:acetylxylan esterase [Phycisphaerales bacterium]
MPTFDLPLSELRSYRPDVSEPPDFDVFWSRTLDEARSFELAADFRRDNAHSMKHVDVFDVSFCGFGGQVVAGWLLRPNACGDDLPCVISYVGYGGGRSLPIAHVWPCAAGFAHFVMDSRGQGASWSPGKTPDPHGDSAPHVPGFLTRGILRPDDYYYRRVITDAVRAIDAAKAHEGVDTNRIALAGASQGGGLAVAAAALAGASVSVLLSDVPFPCHFRRAVNITDKAPFAEIVTYLSCHPDQQSRVFETLSYFDACNFARRVRVDSFFSVGMMDQVCPPSTVFAAYNLIENVRKEIDVYEFNGHEGGGVHQKARWLRILAEYLAESSASQ